MKKYLLCLDESGTFQEQEIKNLTNSSRKCIVGGILIEDYSRKWNDNIAAIFEKWYAEFPIDTQRKLFHATEMKRTANSESYTEIIFDDMHDAGIKFAIFEDDINAFISDSNTTYLNVLSEGIALLLHKLTLIEGKSVELGVIVGRRTSTARNKDIFRNGKIPDYLYEYKINERVDIEKAKSDSPLLKKSSVIIKMKYDKEDDRMILADHVCHFWFTRNSKNYKKKSANGNQTIREKLERYYDDELIFSFLTSDQDTSISRMLNNGTYADALFEYCLGNLSAKNRNLVVRSIAKLPNLAIQSHLENLSNYIKSIIEVERNLELGDRLLENAKKLIEAIKKKGYRIQKFEIDVDLFILAILNHKAKTIEMASVFDEVRPLIDEYTQDTSDINYYLMIQNRYAVYLQDIFEYEKSISVCEEALEVVREMHEVLSGISHKRRGRKGDFRSVQMGKLLGTEVQAYASLVEKDQTLYPKAEKISDLAIKQFDMPMDIQRQYQYRAVLDAAAGNYKSSLKWLEKYYGMPWRKYLSQKDVNVFGIMNLARVADYMSSSSESDVREMGDSVVKAICDDVLTKDKIGISMGYPAVCIYYYIGKNVIQNNKKEGESYLGYVINNGNENPDLVYQIFALKARMLKLDRAYKLNGTVSANELGKFDKLCTRIKKKGLSGAVLKEVDNTEKYRQSIQI